MLWPRTEGDHLCDSDALVGSSMQVDVVRPHACCHDELQLGGLLDELSSHVRRMERGCDDDIGIRQVFRELCGVRTTNSVNLNQRSLSLRTV